MSSRKMSTRPLGEDEPTGLPNATALSHPNSVSLQSDFTFSTINNITRNRWSQFGRLAHISNSRTVSARHNPPNSTSLRLCPPRRLSPLERLQLLWQSSTTTTPQNNNSSGFPQLHASLRCVSGASAAYNLRNTKAGEYVVAEGELLSHSDFRSRVIFPTGTVHCCN